EFYSERDVVHEERRLRTESTPTGKFQEQFDSMFWMSSPYNWPVIGWTSDLNSYTLEEAHNYFDTYYQPGNLVGVIVGDFDPEDVKPLIQSYFGRLQPSGRTVPPVVTLEMPQQAEMRMSAEVEAQPQIEVRYHTVPFNHADSFALEMLSQVLNGRTGRLYKSMVEGAEIASFARAGVDHRRYGGYFSFSAETKKDATPADLEKAWYEQIGLLQQELVADHELDKVKNQVLADAYRALESNFFIMVQVGYYEALGGWEYINDGPRNLRAVTPEDIQRVAKQYFKPENRSVATYLRKAGTSDEQAELAGLDPNIRQMVVMQLKQIQAATDVEALRQEVNQAESMRGQVPQEYLPAIDYLVKKTRERIAELEAAAAQND
ncbi:MAG: insulinase family protein, partial [Phycisphaerales bacterium]|nr:insulinase family protein [Phycisphaerales bacterium]